MDCVIDCILSKSIPLRDPQVVEDNNNLIHSETETFSLNNFPEGPQEPQNKQLLNKVKPKCIIFKVLKVIDRK